MFKNSALLLIKSSPPILIIQNGNDYNMNKTVEIIFSGKVQKVGFRACIRYTAGSLGLTGEVENLVDGRVRALVTGDEIIIEKFLSLTYSCPRAIIKSVKVEDYVLTMFDGFVIKKEFGQKEKKLME